VSADRFGPFLAGCFIGAFLGALWFALFGHLLGWWAT
jgi:hypothetical protein